jgi:molecular chaperone IbpA
MTTAYTVGHSSWRPNIGIGFEKAFSELESVFQDSKHTSYPPYNIFKAGENQHAVEIAVAGFSKEDLDIEVAENTLTITGNKEAKDERDYSHKGISARKFKRQFVLAEYVQVVESTLANGILTIVLEQAIPEEKLPKKISINA